MGWGAAPTCSSAFSPRSKHTICQAQPKQPKGALLAGHDVGYDRAMAQRVKFQSSGIVFVAAALSAAAVFAACGSDVETVDEATTGATNGATTGAMSTSTSGAGGAMSTTTGASMATTTSGGGGSDVCAPAPMDGNCAKCLKSDCCDELEACEADMACKCFRDCKATPEGKGMQGTTTCNMKCGDSSALMMAIRQCRTQKCMSECMQGGPGQGGGMMGGGGKKPGTGAGGAQP